MPPPNYILRKVSVDYVYKDGKKIALAIATHTSTWSRPEHVAREPGPGFKAAIESGIDIVRSDTKEIIQRETDHTSPADTREHIRAVEYNKVQPDNDVSRDGDTGHWPTGNNK